MRYTTTLDDPRTDLEYEERVAYWRQVLSSPMCDGGGSCGCDRHAIRQPRCYRPWGRNVVAMLEALGDS